jgi:hypothetical protein
VEGDRDASRALVRVDSSRHEMTPTIGKLADRKRISVPISIEYLFTFLFGKRTYHGFVGTHTTSEWKRQVLKIIQAIRMAIEGNIDIVDLEQLLQEPQPTSKIQLFQAAGTGRPFCNLGRSLG